MENITLGDIPFEGYAIATYKGKIIWTNRYDGDCPPDIYMMIVERMYIIDDIAVFDLKQKGE